MNNSTHYTPPTYQSNATPFANHPANMFWFYPMDPRILGHNHPQGPRKKLAESSFNRRPRSSWGHDGHRCVQLMFGGPKWNSRWFWWVICRITGDGFTLVDGERCSNLPSRVKNHGIYMLAKWYKGYWGKLQLEMMRYLLNVSWRGNPNP